MYKRQTVDRLYQVADLIPDPAGRKAVEVLAEKLDSEGVEKWYRCFFYNMKLEMEAYYRHKAILNRIVGGSMEAVSYTHLDVYKRQIYGYEQPPFTQ